MTLFKIFGIKVKISYFLIPILVFSFFANYLWQLLAALLIILLHEGVHCLVSYLHNIQVSEIQLFPFGGVVKAENELGNEPIKEVMIAIAGPLFNFTSFFLLAFISRIYDYDNAGLDFLIRTNILIGSFNLLPIIPLDGGRVLRATLTHWLGLRKATKTAIQIGKCLCSIIFILGVLLSVKSIENIYVVTLSLFLYYCLYKENRMANFLLIKEILRKKKTLQDRGIMNTKYLTVLETVDIRHLLEEFSPGKYNFITVVSEDGRILGTLSESEVLDGMSIYGSKMSLGRLVKIIKFKEKQ